MRFLSTFGMLPGTWLNLFLMVLSGISEGFGLTLFIPLLHMMGGQALVDLPYPFSKIVGIFEYLELSATPILLLVLIATLTLGSLFIGYAQKKMLVRARHLYSLELRNRFFGSILRSTWEYSSGLSHGNIVNHLTTESARAGTALSYEVMAVATLLQIALYMVFSTVVSWHLMAVATGFGLLAYFLVRPFTRMAKALGERINKANENLTFYSLEYLRSLKLLKALFKEEKAAEEINKRSEDLYSAMYLSELTTTRVYFLVQSLPVLMLTIIIGVSHEILNMPTPIILVFLLFLARIAPRVAQFQQIFQSYHLSSPAVRTVNEMIEASEAANENMNPSGKTFERIRDSIKLDGVTYQFTDGKQPAVNDVSMIIPRNKMIAIVGGSGAGKSTVMDILTGLRRPETGQVSIDGTDLGDLDLSSWRRHIGIVTQDSMIFNASLRDNLLFFSPDASDEDVASALSIAHLNDVVAELPKGLDTILGEGSVRLSGGQKQRVALARAIIGKPELLLLDEATSALDNESERAVQDAVESIAQTLTIVVIAHRLSTVRRADTIYVMEKGIVVEIGSYNELMDKGGRFSELHGMEFN